jgi:hypothetical protein
MLTPVLQVCRVRLPTFGRDNWDKIRLWSPVAQRFNRNRDAMPHCGDGCADRASRADGRKRLIAGSVAEPVADFNATPGDTGLDPAPMAGSTAAKGSLAVLYERRQREQRRWRQLGGGWNGGSTRPWGMPAPTW